GGEAFIAHGRRYGYFGPTPALLRMPFVIFDLGFGRLSRSYMCVYFVALLIGCQLLLRDVTRLTTGTGSVALRGSAGIARGGAKPSGWSTVVLTVSVGLGSTLFYVGSRAYIYHEAILCGAMFAVFGCWCALRHFEKPDGGWWLGSLACGTLSVHARPPAGLFALTFLGFVAAWHLWSHWKSDTENRRGLLR